MINLKRLENAETGAATLPGRALAAKSVMHNEILPVSDLFFSANPASGTSHKITAQVQRREFCGYNPGLIANHQRGRYASD
jgi:hypothetical protein